MTAWYEGYPTSWDTLDVHKVLEWFTDDCVYEDTTIGHGAECIGQLRKFVKASFRNVPDARFEYVRGTDNGEGYAIEWIMQPMGIRGASVGQLRDGKISVNREYWNGTAYQVPNT
jgi:SnoaL-like domain